MVVEKWKRKVHCFSFPFLSFKETLIIAAIFETQKLNR